MIHLHRRNQTLSFPRLVLDETGKGRQDAYLTCALAMFFLLSFLALVIEPLQKFIYIKEEDLLPFEKFLKLNASMQIYHTQGQLCQELKSVKNVEFARKPNPWGTPRKN